MAGDVAHAHDHQPKAKLFISYSRKDMAFADRLEAGLRSRGFEPLIDRTEIYAFEDWWRRIEELIVRADTIVFVLSPDAVASDVCAKEVAFAASLNKRFAPIVRTPVDANAVPEPLRRLNFVFFTDEAQFENSADQLAEALSTDIEWIRKHTDFGHLARRWAGAGRPGPRGLLLHSPVLEEAERWIAARPHGAPSPTSDTQDFIIESRKAATRRRNILSGSLAAGLAVAIGLTTLAYWMLRVSESRRNDALIAQSQFLARDARAAIAQGNATLGALLALAALPSNLSAPDRPFVNEAALALEAAMANQRERLIIPNAGSLNAIAVAPNGSPILATAKGNPNQNGWSKTVRIIDIGTGKELISLSHRLGVYDLRLSSDATRLISLTLEPDDNKNRWHVQVWEISSGRELFRLDELEDKPEFSSDGRRILLTGDAKANELRDAQTGTLIKSWPPKEISSAQFSPDGKTVLAVAFGKDAAQLWSAETGEVIRSFEPIAGYASAPRQAFSPDGSLVVIKVDNFSGKAKIFDTRTGSEVGSFGAQAQAWSDVAFSPDNSRAVTRYSFQRTAQLLDIRTGAVIASFDHEKQIASAAFSSDGRRLVTVSEDRVSLRDSANGAEIASVRSRGQDDNTTSSRQETVAWFSPAGDRLLVAFDAASTQLLDARTGSQIARLSGVARSISEQYQVNTIGYAQSIGETAFSPDERLVVTVDENRAAHIWNLANGRRLSTLLDGGATTASFLPDGNRILTFAGTIGVWHEEPLTVEVFRSDAGALNSATLSRNRNFLAAADADSTVRVWDANKHVEVKVLRGHQAQVHSVAFSPDGELIVTASADRTARVWNSRDGTILHVLRGHESTVRSAFFSPDGKHIVTASDDKTVRLWDAVTGGSIKMFQGNDRAVYSAVFSPDGRYILSAADGALTIWDVETGKSARTLRQRYDRNSNDRSDMASAESLGQIIRSQEGVKRPFAYYSADGTRIVGALSGAVELWNVASDLPNWLIFDRNTTWSARFSPDGHYVVTAADDGAVRLWSEKHWSGDGDGTISDDPVVTLAINNGRMNSVEFSSSGNEVVFASSDGSARIWNVAHCQTLIERARSQLPRTLTQRERKQHYLTNSTITDLFSAIRPYAGFLLPTSPAACD